jgi:chromosome segregation protein
VYLKKLDIIGFKSFANKTTIDFSRGITAIVGPNGCGKTNILDALRWVLGEQKVSMLRGSKMEEVIFNGTRDAKALGMAEVTLTLVNNLGILPVEYTEVQITRRLFRSGESEYLLNKVPCRLKDITELFYGTGVGAHSYSVIQQDMIESIVSDKAEERRFLFEEAAGITKYKQHKKIALRKLEATENDFLRLNDIYSEVQTQVRSLKRQYKKAERYQIFADEIKDWDLYLTQTKLNEIEHEKRQIKTEFDQLNDNIIEKETGIDSYASQLEATRKSQLDLEQDMNRIGNKIYDATEVIHSREKEISILNEKKSNANILIERNQNEIESLKTRSKSLIEQLTEIDKELNKQKSIISSLETELKIAETKQIESDRNLLTARTSKEKSNQHMIELESRLSSGKTEDGNLREQMDELSEQIEKLKFYIDDNVKIKIEIDKQKKDIDAKLEESLQSKQKAENEFQSKTKELEISLVKSNDLNEEISQLNASMEAAQARKSLLEEMIIHYEGYESGVKSAMEVRELFNDIDGTVAEKFIPVKGMEIAVEASLGEMAKFLICNNRTCAEEIVSYLKKESKGRIGILVPDSGTINPVVKRPELNFPEFIGWLDNFVTTDEKLKPLMQAVLSRTAVFKSGFNPDEILERLPYGFKAVSDEGELFSKNIIAGGSDDQFPLFRRKEKVNEQDEIIEKINIEIEKAQSQKNKITIEIGGLRNTLNKISDEIETLDEELDNIKQKLNESEFRFKSIENDIKRLENEKNQTSEKFSSIKNKQFSLGLNFDELATKKNTLISQMKESSVELLELENLSSKASGTVSKLHLKIVENRSLIDQTESKINHTNELIQEISNSIESKTSEIATAKIEINSSEEKIIDLEAKLKISFEERQKLNEEQNSFRATQNDIMGNVTEKEKVLRQLRNEKDSLSNRSHSIEIKLTTIEAEIKSIIERMTEDYEVDIRNIKFSNPDESISQAVAVKKLTEYKDRLKKFGAVNLLALEEYKTASEREEFLREQLEDLATAKSDLKSTITKINQTARKLFEETFAQVKINFQNLFTELFSGGEADVYLKDPNDPLESDIEIFARPRGKKLLSITMMSGGERALTAISLLFSLYLVKPSPFCILDEIDAPLDDANCRRFLKIIENFSNQTQFIVITHNKLTMEAAHNLYGITMEQFGISKMVAVKFNENEGFDEESDELIIDRDSINFEEELNSLERPVGQLEGLIPDESDGNGNGNGKVKKVKSEINAQIIIEPPQDDIPSSPDELPEIIAERIGEKVVEISSEDEDNNQD